MEIDLVAINSITGEVGFFEVKWRELSYGRAKKVLKALKEKSTHIKLETEKRHYGLIAKGVEEKEKLRDEGFLVFDLKDF